VKDGDDHAGRGGADRRDAGPRPPLTIDGKWREVADAALAFVKRFA
jgi:hypothetical protein